MGDLGLTFTEKWTTDNTLNTTLDVADKLLPGLKVTLDTNFSPATGSKSGKLKTEYKHEAATITADMDLGLSAINATAVVGHKGWLAGYQTCFDLTKSAVTKNNFGLGYTAPDFVLHTCGEWNRLWWICIPKGVSLPGDRSISRLEFCLLCYYIRNWC